MSYDTAQSFRPTDPQCLFFMHCSYPIHFGESIETERLPWRLCSVFPACRLAGIRRQKKRRQKTDGKKHRQHRQNNKIYKADQGIIRQREASGQTTDKTHHSRIRLRVRTARRTPYRAAQRTEPAGRTSAMAHLRRPFTDHPQEPQRQSAFMAAANAIQRHPLGTLARLQLEG